MAEQNYNDEYEQNYNDEYEKRITQKDRFGKLSEEERFEIASSIDKNPEAYSPDFRDRFQAERVSASPGASSPESINTVFPWKKYESLPPRPDFSSTFEKTTSLPAPIGEIPPMRPKVAKKEIQAKQAAEGTFTNKDIERYFGKPPEEETYQQFWTRHGIDPYTGGEKLPEGTGYVVATLPTGERVMNVTTPGKKSTSDWDIYSKIDYIRNTPAEKQYQDYLADFKKQYPGGPITRKLNEYGTTVTEGQPIPFEVFKKDIPRRISGAYNALFGVGEEKPTLPAYQGQPTANINNPASNLLSTAQQRLQKLFAMNDEKMLPARRTMLNQETASLINLIGSFTGAASQSGYNFAHLGLEERKLGLEAEKIASALGVDKATIARILEETETSRAKRATIPPSYAEEQAGKERLATLAHPPKDISASILDTAVKFAAHFKDPVMGTFNQEAYEAALPGLIDTLRKNNLISGALESPIEGTTKTSPGGKTAIYRNGEWVWQ